MIKEKKRYVRIMKGVPEFMYMDENTARMIAGKGGWIPSPEPQKIEKEVWTPEEPEEEEVEIDTTIIAEFKIDPNKLSEFKEAVNERGELPTKEQVTEFLDNSVTVNTPVVKRGRKPKQ